MEAAIARGHTLTLFHRGQTNPGLFPGIEVVTGDREHDLERLARRRDSTPSQAAKPKGRG